MVNVYIYIPFKKKFLRFDEKDFKKFLMSLEPYWCSFFLKRIHKEEWLDEFKDEKIFEEGKIKDLLDYYIKLKEELKLKEKRKKEEKRMLKKEIKRLLED